MAGRMLYLIFVFLALECVASESRRRHLRTDPEAFGQPDFGFNFNPREARAYVPLGSNPYDQPAKHAAPSREHAPSNFYLPEQQDAPTRSSPTHPTSQSKPVDSAFSYHPQASFESIPQSQNSFLPNAEPVYSPVLAYDDSKRSSAIYAPQVAQYVPRSKPYAPSAQTTTTSRPSESLNYAPSVTRFTSPAQSRYVAPIAIVKQTRDDQYDGTFSFGFESENGIASSANGYVKSISPEEQAQVMQGTYSYTAPDGTPVVTRWFADETGFHAEGAHLPVAPRPYMYN